MNVHLDWQVGPAGDDEGVVALRPPQLRPRRVARRFALTRGFLALYLAALVVAGTVGFGLGRWSEAQATLRAGIERSAGLETAAWQAADQGLLTETLDPSAAPDWRAAVLSEFLRHAPERSYDLRVLRVDQPSADRATATVEVRSGGPVRREQRSYLRRDGSWYRIP